MGDRTYARFYLGGHIETVAELEALVEAIENEGVRDVEGGATLTSKTEVQTNLRYCIENNRIPAFDDDEVNYGVFHEIEDCFEEIDGLGVHFSWDAGGDYEAGQKTMMPDGSVFTASGKDGAAVPVYDLARARESDDPLAAIDKLIAEAQKAEGKDLPPFTVSPAVAAYLKIFADKVA